MLPVLCHPVLPFISSCVCSVPHPSPPLSRSTYLNDQEIIKRDYYFSMVTTMRGGGYCGALQRTPPPIPAALNRRLMNRGQGNNIGKVRRQEAFTYSFCHFGNDINPPPPTPPSFVLRATRNTRRMRRNILYVTGNNNLIFSFCCCSSSSPSPSFAVAVNPR